MVCTYDAEKFHLNHFKDRRTSFFTSGRRTYEKVLQVTIIYKIVMVSNIYFTFFFSTYLKYLVQGRFAESSSAFSQMLRHIITCFHTPLWLALPLTIQTLQQVAFSFLLFS